MFVLAAVLFLASQDPNVGRYHLATLHVYPVAHALHHTITIRRDGPPDVPPTQEEWSTHKWRAVREIENRREEITSDECPAILRIAEGFRSLPPLTPSSAAARVHGDGDGPNIISAIDRPVEITFRTASRAYARVAGIEAWGTWAAQAVHDLNSCWEEPIV
jgi:hypothetical protein